MTSLVPLVLSDIPSIRSVLDDSSAFFFTPDDADALVATLRIVLSDNSAHKRAQNAALLAEGYTWKARATAILSFVS